MIIEINKVMYVWDTPDTKFVKMVSHIDTVRIFPVVCRDGTSYEYCDETEKSEKKRMSNSQLSRWLDERPGREWKGGVTENMCVCRFYNYVENMADEEVPSNILVRQDGGEWKVPEVGVSW